MRQSGSRGAGAEPTRLGPVEVSAEAAGQPLNVVVHLAEAGGRVFCVGLDLHAVDGQPVTTATVRGLRTAEVIETALAKGRAMLEVFLEGMPDEHSIRPEMTSAAFHATAAIEYRGTPTLNRTRPELGADVEALFTPAPETRKRRGPKPLINDDALRRVVVPAYQMGGHRPVQAVKAALLQSGLLGNRVTIDQARKAVASARVRGFLAPATTGRRSRSEGQP